MNIYRRKTLVEVDLAIWAQLRHFATIHKLSVNETLELLLTKALNNCGYETQKHTLMPASESFTASSQQASSEGVQ
jgi:hypothetical protein